MSKTTKNGHILYTDGDQGIPEQIVDQNGSVVLDLCKTCNKGEAELVEDCPHPPLVREGEGASWPSVPGGVADLCGTVTRLESNSRVIVQLNDGSETWLEHNNAQPLIIVDCEHWGRLEASTDGRSALLFALCRVIEGISNRHPQIVSPHTAMALKRMRVQEEGGDDQ